MSGVKAHEQLGRPASSGAPSPGAPSPTPSRWLRASQWWRRHKLARSLTLLVVSALALALLSEVLSEYRNLQLADAAYYFTALAGLSLLIGLSGQISLGHGALMAVGAYTVALLVANEHWPLVAALIASVLVTTLVGIAVGAAGSRLRGPYLAGATLAFAVGLPGLAYQYSGTFGGANGIATNPPAVPAALGSSFPLERWEAWIACAGAVLVAFALYNLIHSGVGRSWRAVRDDEIAATVSGLRVSRTQTLAFTLSAACAGLGGGLLAIVLQLANPGAFPLVLSFYLLAAVVIGGLGSLLGAAWGAAILVFLPSWTHDLAQSFSLPDKVGANLPLAIYGVVLIAAMLVWPSGIQGAVRAVAGFLRDAVEARSASGSRNAITEPEEER
ncbi:MAG TPA: branched-chain amino acid ABC transporter permease [Solirubrobacteraceae bacterium]|jgi:branched-chain amino acid transport system permease protein